MMGMCDHEPSDVDADAAPDSELEATPPPPAIVAMLVGNHREFLAYVQRRVGDRALAEEILQAAFVKSLDRADQIRDSAIGWFYRVLRNAVIDHQRRHASAARRLDAFAAELETSPPDGEMRDAVCQCVARLAETLKPEYASVLRRVEIDGMSVKDYAAEAGITSSNAGVRIFRAREALRKQVARSCGTCADHGCYQCTCGASTTSGCDSH
jgi:RNA polymerase sigma factor (sigma-70 family)